MSDERTVLYELAGDIATITLNRPQVYNAFNPQLHRELLVALRQAASDTAARVVVITGAGKAFCSGQDLKEIPTDGSRSLLETLRSSYNPLILTLRALPKPVVAAVNGVAAGAGMSLALACDFRIAVESARFVASFVNIGLVPDSGMTYLLPRLVGYARAVELCMLGGTIDATTAHSYGLVNQVTTANEFTAAVHQFAERLANGPATALGLMKRGFEFALDATLEQVLEHEALTQQIAGTSQEYFAGVAAFREKRPARFRPKGDDS
jgi:2-(1,2-epoxy-1,2-dihydrophenyl)acetyl-CoA isomerase